MKNKVVRVCLGLIFMCVFTLSIGCTKTKNSSFALHNERLIVWENPDSAWHILQQIDQQTLTHHEQLIYQLEYQLALSRTQHTPYYKDTILNLLPHLIDADDLLALGEAYYMLGTSYNHTSDYQSSIFYLKQAEETLETFLENKNISDQEKVLANHILGITWFCLGNTYESEMLYEIAHEYYHKAIPLLEQHTNTIFLACAYRDLARTNALLLGNKDSTKVWFAQAERYVQQTNNPLLSTEIAAYKYQYCETDSIDQRLRACLTLADKYDISTRYAEIIEIYLNKQNIDSAAYYLEKLTPTDSTYAYWFEQNHAYWNSRILSAQDKNQEAYTILLSLYEQTIHQLQRDASTRTFSISRQYDVEREQRKSEQLQREKQWHKRISAILILTLTLTIMLLIVWWLYYKAKRKEHSTQMQALRNKYIQQLQLALERLQQKVNLTREMELQRMRGNEVEFPKWLQTYRDEKLVMNKDSINQLITSIDKALDGAISRLQSEYPLLTESDMQFAILSIIGASDNDMSIVLNVQKHTIYHRRQIVRKHINASRTPTEQVTDIDTWLREYVLNV